VSGSRFFCDFYTSKLFNLDGCPEPVKQLGESYPGGSSGPGDDHSLPYFPYFFAAFVSCAHFPNHFSRDSSYGPLDLRRNVVVHPPPNPFFLDKYVLTFSVAPAIWNISAGSFSSLQSSGQFVLCDTFFSQFRRIGTSSCSSSPPPCVYRQEPLLLLAQPFSPPLAFPAYPVNGLFPRFEGLSNCFLRSTL